MPRAGLSRARVVAEAALVADDVGWEHLTMALVAARLGVRLPSLYKHVESLEALRLGVAALATRELAQALTTACVGVTRQRGLRAFGTAYRAYATSHPGRYAATVRPPRSQAGSQHEAAAALLTVVLAILASYGIEGDDGIDAARGVRSALHGFAALETAGGFGLPRDVDRSFEALLDGVHDMLDQRGRRSRPGTASDLVEDPAQRA